MTRSPRTLLTALAAVAVSATLAPAALAAPVPVTDGAANWWQANVYNALPERTFLGHVTRPGNPNMGRSNGTVLASNGATATHPDGTSVDGAHPEAEALMGPNRIYTFHYSALSGTIDPVAKTADVTAKGTVSFAQYPGLTVSPPPAVITVENPRIVLNGDGTGGFYASGSTSTAGVTYSADAPLFTIDASAAQFNALGGGEYVVTGLVPALGQTGVFGAANQYAIGAGPERNPNTWGGFSLFVGAAVAPAEKIVEKVVPGPAVPAAAPKLVVLERAITKTAFRGAKGKSVRVQIRKRGEWTVLGQGFVQGRLLTLILPEGTKLSGEYVLRRVGGSSKLPKSVKVATQDGSTKAKKAKKSKKSAK